MLAPPIISLEEIRRIRRSEYELLIAKGFFEDEHLELLEGFLIKGAPASPAHAQAATELSKIFVLVSADRFRVRVRLPLAASEISEPGPDLALVPLVEYSRGHPSQAYLVVEIAEARRAKERDLKARIYAAAGVPEYWLVELEHRWIEVRSRPLAGEYSTLTTHTSGALSPAAFSDIHVPVASLLP